MYLVSIPLTKLVQSLQSLSGQEERPLERKQGSSQQTDHNTSHPLYCCGLSCQDSILIFHPSLEMGIVSCWVLQGTRRCHTLSAIENVNLPFCEQTQKNELIPDISVD